MRSIRTILTQTLQRQSIYSGRTWSVVDSELFTVTSAARLAGNPSTVVVLVGLNHMIWTPIGLSAAFDRLTAARRAIFQTTVILTPLYDTSRFDCRRRLTPFLGRRNTAVHKRYKIVSYP